MEWPPIPRHAQDCRASGGAFSRVNTAIKTLPIDTEKTAPLQYRGSSATATPPSRNRSLPLGSPCRSAGSLARAFFRLCFSCPRGSRLGAREREQRARAWRTNADAERGSWRTGCHDEVGQTLSTGSRHSNSIVKLTNEETGFGSNVPRRPCRTRGPALKAAGTNGQSGPLGAWPFLICPPISIWCISH